MIRTGILSNNQARSEPARLITLFKELTVSSASFDKENPDGQCDAAAKEIIRSSDIIYTDLPALSAEQIKTAFRNSTHIYCKRIPSLTVDEINELINLENEAGCVTQIFHPHLFLPENLALFRDLQIPLLVNIRLKAGFGPGLETQLRSMLLILALLDKSSMKKLDVSTFEGKNDSSVMDIRMSCSSGSIARLILSAHFQEDQSVLELFQTSKPIVSVPVIPLSRSLELISEQQAISEFIKAVKGQPAMLLSLSELLQVQQIMQKISEKLKYRGSILLQQELHLHSRENGNF